MVGECPSIYDNYTALGIKPTNSELPENHANIEWSILNSLVKHANFIIPFSRNETDNQGNSYHRYPAELLLEFIKNYPNTIIIM